MLIAAFSGLQSYAQQNYDFLFSLHGYRRNAKIQEYLVFKQLPKEEKMGLIDQLRAKGNESDKCQAGFIAELMDLPEQYYEQKLGIAGKYFSIAKRLDDHYLLANFYYYISEVYSLSGFHFKSFENKLYCLDELKQDPQGHYFEQSWLLHQVAAEYYRFHDYTVTVNLCKIAFTFNGKNSPSQSWMVKVISNLIGMSYLNDNHLDSAKRWLQNTYDIAVEQNDTPWMGISIGNIGHIYYLQKRYAEAIPYYQKALIWCRTTSLWDNVAPFCCTLADCYLQTGNLKAVEELLTEARSAIAKEYNLPNLIKYYSTASAWYRTTGNTLLALQSVDSLYKYEKLQTEEYNINKKIQAEAQLALQKKELYNQIARQKIQKGQWLMVGLCITLVLLCIIAILIYKRQRLRHVLFRKKLEHDKYRVTKELTQAMTEIRDFTRLMQEKNELIEKFTQEIAILRQQHKSISDDQLQHIEQLKQSAILTEDDWDNFKQLFEKVHPGYLNNLKAKYPHLTPAETRYLVFAKLELNNRKMSAMLGVSSEAIRNIRFRIKKKLALDDGNDIDRLANEI